MDIDWTRVFWGAAAGAVIGLLIVLATAITRRLLDRRSEIDETAPPTLATEAPRARGIRFGITAAVVIIPTIAFAIVAYRHGPTDPTPEAPPAQTAAAEPAPGTKIDLGGVSLNFVPPTGFCLFPEPTMETALAAQKRLNRENVVHTIFGDCDQVQSSSTTNARIRDFGMLMTPTSLTGKAITRADLDQMVRETVDPAAVKKTVDRRISEAQARLSMQSFSSLGILDRDDRAVYFGFLSKVHSGDRDFEQASILSMAVIRGREISYCLYSDYSRDPRGALQRLLNRTKQGVGDLADQNR